MPSLAHKKRIFSFVVSVTISVFAVTLIASAVTYISDTSVGVATDTPGAAVGVKGAGIFEGFVSADYFISTSTGTSLLINGKLGVATTSVATGLDVGGNPSAAFGIGVGAPPFAFGWADNAYYHILRSSGADNGSLKLSLRNGSSHYITIETSVGIGATTTAGSSGTTLGVAGFMNVKGDLNISATSTSGSFSATSTASVGTSSPSTNDRFTVDGMTLLAGHVESQGNPPVLTSCGTAPSAVGTDQTGKITIGSSASVSDPVCIATFVNPWLNAPACMVSNETTSETITVVTTATAMTLSATATPSGYVISYHCWGYK